MSKNLSRCRLTVEELEDRLVPTAGMLDPSWGAVTRLLTPVGAAVDSAAATAVQADGKFLLAGYAVDGNGGEDFAVVRYHADGRLDSSFGGDGKITTPIGSLDDRATAIAVQPNGKIVVAGRAQVASTYLFAVVRYNADGSLDTTFDGDGKLTITVGVSNATATCLALQPDGKIVLGGHAWNGTDYDFALTRVNADGSLDSTFDGDGTRFNPIGSDDDFAFALAVQPDGKLVLGGYRENGIDPDIALARVNADGSLDTSFDGDGKLTTALSPANDGATALAVQANGEIVVGGYRWNGTDIDLALVRYRSDGSLLGQTITPVGTGDDYAVGLAIQPDGKIVLGANGRVGSGDDFAAVRYLPSGVLDSSFGNGGVARISVGDGDATATSVALQADGKILVGGDAIDGSSRDFALVRFTANGTLDRLANGAGKVSVSVGSADDLAEDVAVQPDGKIVVVGTAIIGNDRDFAVLRYLPDGTPDPSFGFEGRATVGITPQGSDSAKAVAIQDDGKIVVAGRTFANSPAEIALARFHANGSLDTTFDGDGTLTTSVGADSAFIASVAVQPDGKIVVAGGTSFTVPTRSLFVVRYHSDGSLDTGFADNGKRFFGYANSINVAEDMTLQPDGKIVVVGTVIQEAVSFIVLFRFLPDGGLDGTFGLGGSRLFTPGSANAVAVQPDGKIVVAGWSSNGNNDDILLARVLPDGNSDASFSLSGISTVSLGSTHDRGIDLAVLPDGKIVVAAQAFLSDFSEFVVLRYHPDGGLDSSFDFDGIITTTFRAQRNVATALAIQPNGAIVVAGSALGASNFDFAIARYRGDNRAPVALPAPFSVSEDATLTVSAPTYFHDPDGDVVTTTLLAGPAHGTLVLNAYGQFTYTPFANYHGPDSFSYRLTDSYGGVSTGSVSLTVNAVNDAPVGVADTVITHEDTPVLIAILDNDRDVENAPLSVVPFGTPVNGSPVLNPDGTVTFTPQANFHGVASFQYRVSDGSRVSDVVTVTVTVLPVNDAPFAAPDSYTVAEDGVLNGASVLGNDNDVEGSSLGARLVSGPAHAAQFTLNLDGTFSYTPLANFNGGDRFTYQAVDVFGAASAVTTVSIAISAVNDAPTVVNDYFAVEGPAAAHFAVLSNDSTAPDSGETLTITARTHGRHGSVTITGGGTGLSYTPGGNYAGLDWFTYTVSDGSSTATATVLVDVTGVNQPPTLSVPGPLAFLANTPLTVSGIGANDVDANQGSGQMQATLSVLHGKLTLSSTAGLTFVAGANGTSALTVTGALASVNAALNNLVYRGGVNFAGSDLISVTVDDRGNTGSGGILSVSRTIALSPVTNQAGLQSSASAPGKLDLVVYGTNAADTVTVAPNGTSTTKLKVTLNGKPQGVFVPTGRILVYGYDGNDTITIHNKIGLTAILRGGDGNDTLTGGKGNDLLLGEAGNDRLVKGLGLNVLIGGLGADTITGGAGDDLLIGGRTTHDNDGAMLDAVLATWAGSTAYATRVSNLRTALLVDGSTVLDDGATDALTGGLGSDWFFTGVLDSTDRAPSEESN